MIRRLVEQDYFSRPAAPAPDQVRFWLRELRTPELLIDVAAEYPGMSQQDARAAVKTALHGDPGPVAEALEAEEREERRKDREYWAPLRRELEELRHHRDQPKPPS